MRHSSKRHSCRHKLTFDSLEMRSLLAAAGAAVVAHTAAGESSAAPAGHQHTAAISTMNTHHARVRIHRAAITAKDDRIVTALYERILHRSPGAAELQHWDRLLARGFGEKSVARAIRNSSEGHRLLRAPNRTGLAGARTAGTGTALAGIGTTGTTPMFIATEPDGTSPTVVGTSTGTIGVGTTQASTGTLGSGTTLTGSGSTGTGTELPGTRSLGMGTVETGTRAGTRGASTGLAATGTAGTGTPTPTPATTGLATTGTTVSGTTGPDLFGTGTIGTASDGTSFINIGTTGSNVTGADTLGAETSVIRTGFTPTPGALSAIETSLLPLGIVTSATEASMP